MSTIIFNNKIISADTPCIRYNDRGFTLGHGLFETILIKNNTYPALDYHWTRLVAGASLIGINPPFGHSELEVMLKQLIISNNLQNKLASARVTITHGEASRGILPAQAPEPNFLITVCECAEPNDKPYSALIVNTRKNEHSISSRVKTISYIDNILAKQEAMLQGYDEAILLNSVANVADGSISNIFMVKNDQIFTPPVSDGALPGVIRAILLEEFKQDFSITEKSISASDLINASEVFLTNSLMGVKSLNRINNRSFDNFIISNQLSLQLRKSKNYI